MHNAPSPPPRANPDTPSIGDENTQATGITADIVGCGDIGLRLAQLYSDRGQHCRGWVRSAAQAQRLQDQGLAVEHIDLDSAEHFPICAKALFWFAPPPKKGDEDSRLQRFLDQLQTQPKHLRQLRRIVYISTPAVYGDCDGNWIRENHPTNPLAARGHRRLDAERQLQAAAIEKGLELIILRVPGIYGPGRWPLQRLRAGTPVVREQDAPFTNRIHQDDLAALALLAMDNAQVTAGNYEVFHASDGQPSNMTDYFNQVADAFGIERPKQITRSEANEQLSPALLHYLRESKRLRNDKAQEQLDWRPKYPNLAAGLLERGGSPA